MELKREVWSEDIYLRFISIYGVLYIYYIYMTATNVAVKTWKWMTSLKENAKNVEKVGKILALQGIRQGTAFKRSWEYNKLKG